MSSPLPPLKKKYISTYDGYASTKARHVKRNTNSSINITNFQNTTANLDTDNTLIPKQDISIIQMSQQNMHSLSKLDQSNLGFSPMTKSHITKDNLQLPSIHSKKHSFMKDFSEIDRNMSYNFLSPKTARNKSSIQLQKHHFQTHKPQQQTPQQEKIIKLHQFKPYIPQDSTLNSSRRQNNMQMSMIKNPSDKEKRENKKKTQQTLSKLQEQIRLKYENQTNPLGNNKIQTNNMYIKDVKDQFLQFDVNGNNTNQIKPEYFPHCLQSIDQLIKKSSKNMDSLSNADINEGIDNINELLKNTNIPLLQLQGLLLKAKFNQKSGNVYGALRALFVCKTFARFHKYTWIKVKCYKNIGKCYIDIKKYNKAKSVLLKMLILSWMLKNHFQEIIAYDMLGMVYFYSGELGMSKQLHQRSLIGKTEVSITKDKKVKLYENIESQTEAERNVEKLKNMYKDKLQQNDNESDGADYESSDEEQDEFLREIVSNEMLNKNKQADLFEEEKEKSMKYKSMNIKKKKINEQENKQNSLFEEKNQPFLTYRLSHLSYNRSSNNYKLMSKYDLLKYQNEEDKVFCFLITPKIIEYLRINLQKLKKKVLLVEKEYTNLKGLNLKMEVSRDLQPVGKKSKLIVIDKS